jgi:hypothetical protein
MKKWHIVYPYKLPDNPEFGWELKYSLRSLVANFVDDFDDTVIGDIPDWINQETVRCIELKNDNLPAQRQSKINQKILKATELFEDFIVFNDDIFLMRSTLASDLQVPRKIGDLQFNFRKPKTPNSFTAQCRNSYYTLKDLGKQFKKNFVSHCPHYYETEKIKEIQQHIDLAPISFPSVIFENIYFNFFGEYGEESRGFRCGCWSLKCKKYNGEQILNFDETGASHNPWIKKIIEEKFNKKSRFEL